MLSVVLAHQAGARGLHDVAGSWSTDPLIPIALVLAAWIYHRGSRRRRGRPSTRSRCFFAGIVALAVALVSPLDAVATELASAHMVQHVLLVVVAAPLLAFSAPAATLLAGVPPGVARAAVAVLRRVPRARFLFRALGRPSVAWLLHTATLWLWHASGPYDAAVAHDVVHAAEHVSFVATGVLFWSAIVHVRHAPRTSYGFGALLVFTMALQSVFLAALLTFATRPWYRAYRDTTVAWGLEPLADQQLAGALMWVPGGLIYAAVGVSLIAAWLRSTSAGDGDDWGFGAEPETVMHPADSPR